MAGADEQTPPPAEIVGPVPATPPAARRPQKRHVRFIAPLQQQYLDVVAAGMGVYEACHRIGISHHTLRDLRNRCPQFAAQEREARERATDSIEGALWRTGMAGSVGAQAMWLCNRRPADWRDPRQIARAGGDLKVWCQGIEGDVVHLRWDDGRDPPPLPAPAPDAPAGGNGEAKP